MANASSRIAVSANSQNAEQAHQPEHRAERATVTPTTPPDRCRMNSRTTHTARMRPNHSDPHPELERGHHAGGIGLRIPGPLDG